MTDPEMILSARARPATRPGMHLLPRAGSERSGGNLLRRASCSRCGSTVASTTAFADTDQPALCWGCVEGLRPRSTWPGHSPCGTWWIDAALEHERRHDGTVLMAHGTLLCRYRPVGPGEWDLVDVPHEVTSR